jgi:lipopolysaccharide/colanic/teichoic acid biosynthesis glycosyltransferase
VNIQKTHLSAQVKKPVGDASDPGVPVKRKNGVLGLANALERTAAFVGLVFLSPIGILIGIAIRAEDGGPVFYGHRRVGRDFVPFRLWKFRTMVPGADRMGGPVTVAGDPRVTRVGRLLRRYKLDELPQLFNVLRGEMGLVGPRPESERYVALFRTQYAQILQHRPGITDPATLAFRNEEELLAGENAEQLYREQILPRKLALSAAYLQSQTLLSDCRIIGQTLLRILQRPGAGDVPAMFPPGDRHTVSPAASPQPAACGPSRRAPEGGATQ